MKKIVFLILTGLLIAGCNLQNDPVSSGEDLYAGKTWLKHNSGLTIEEQITVCKTFNGSSGGNFNFNDKPNDVKISGKLTVPSNAFTGVLDICILLDGQTTFLTFTPEYDFDKSLLLDLTYRNVDLRGVDPSDLEFYYINDDGYLSPAEYESKLIDIEKGVLKITQVKINHFSRYGWAK